MSVLPLVFKGRLGIAVLGRGLLLFEFGSSFEAKRVLVRGKRWIKEKLLHLERWSPEVGCFYKGANANEAWVRWWVSHFICGTVRCSKNLVMVVEVLWL